MIVIEETAASIWPDWTAANRPWKGMFTISTFMPLRLPISLTRSISKPTMLAAGVLELPGHVADVGADLQAPFRQRGGAEDGRDGQADGQ